MRFKRLAFVGTPAVAVFITEYTKKVKVKFEKIEFSDKHSQAQSTGSYKSKVSNEMRTPI